VTTSNGSAFVNSDESFENLGKNKLGIKTPKTNTTNQLQIELLLVRALTEKWTSNMCKTISCLLENPKLNQAEIAEILKIPQSHISRRLKAAFYYEIIEYVKLANQKLQNI
jgi:predicted XRE-type DNA-binding protein